MIPFLAVMATVGAASSVARLIIAWLDYRRKWVRLPAERVFGWPRKKSSH